MILHGTGRKERKIYVFFVSLISHALLGEGGEGVRGGGGGGRGREGGGGGGGVHTFRVSNSARSASVLYDS